MGSGTSIDVTQDRWLANGEIAKVSHDANIIKVSELIDGHHCWNMEALRIHFHPSFAISALQTPIS